MSSLLLIIPAGWIQLDWEYVSNNYQGLSQQSVEQGTLMDIEAALKLGELISAEASLQEFKLIDNTYFIIRLG